MNFNLSCSCNENFHFMKITKMNSISIGPCLIYEIKVPFFLQSLLKTMHQKKRSHCVISKREMLHVMNWFLSMYLPLTTGPYQHNSNFFCLIFKKILFFFFFQYISDVVKTFIHLMNNN